MTRVHRTNDNNRDWKKLTFYYFADAYINFNSLVTDLFKIYKTRIWMSAINPASFASPTLGIQAPSGIGPGAVGLQRGAERRQNQQQLQQPQQQQQQQPQPQPDQHQHGAFGGMGPQARGPPNMFSPPLAGDKGPFPGPNYGQGGGGYPYSHLGAVAPGRPANMPYTPGMMPSMDSYSFPQAGDYQAKLGRFQTPPGGNGPHDAGVSTMGPPGDWVGGFQGLSLNSR